MKSKKLICVAALLLSAPTVIASNTLYVNGVSGNDGDTCTSPTTACKTIGHAISLAASGETIVVAAATYAEYVQIGISVTIVGSGVATTIIHGGITISSTSADVALRNLSITNGTTGGIAHGGEGGGILNKGVLVISHVVISGNSAVCFPKTTNEACAAAGGGIANFGTLTISNSTVSGNRVVVHCFLLGLVCSAKGGGIFNNGRLTVNNSTISGNSVAKPCGSALCFANGGGISGGGTIINSTVSGNSLGGIFGSGAISNSTISGNSGYGIDSGGGTVTLQNSIVANNGGNCSGKVTSHGYNLSSDGTCNLSGPGDLNNHDPLLGPLQNNGGPTQTMALLSGSPAIDAGNPAGCTDGQGHLLTTDQRGMPRPDKEDPGSCDMGAYERQSD